jgi:hypothetical protein
MMDIKRQTWMHGWLDGWMAGCTEFTGIVIHGKEAGAMQLFQQLMD